MLAIVVFVASAAYFVGKRTWLARGMALATLFMLGALNLQSRLPSVPTCPWTSALADGRELSVLAHVVAEGNIQKAGFAGLRQRIDLETEEITFGGATVRENCGLRLGVYAKELEQEAKMGAAQPMRVFLYGERLRFTAKLRLPRNFRNPGAFNYEGYLADNAITILASGRAAQTEVLPGFVGTRWELWRTRLHRSVIEKIHALWPPSQAALIDAMVIGEEAFVERDERVNFQRSGAYHILVVSGMNVSILAAVIFCVLRRLRVNDAVSTVFTIVLSAGYAMLTSVGSPVWRAVLMMSLYLVTRLLYRQRSMLNALGAAALGLLVVDPRVLLGASFQMTFLSVFIIAAIGVPILERTSHPYRQGLKHLDQASYDFSVEPAVAQMRLDLRMIGSRLARFIGNKVSLAALGSGGRVMLGGCEILFISFLMQLGLSLPMAHYFHRATVVGVPSNALVVPLTGLLMPTAISAVCVGYVSPLIARIPVLFASLALNGITGTVHFLGDPRVADLRVPTPELASTLAGLAALGFAMVLARRHLKLAGLGIAALLASALWLSLVRPAPKLRANMLEVTAIDVGEGDSILLVTPEGKLLLVDAGGPVGGQQSQLDFGEDVVSPYLWSRGISRLDAVAVTHGHSDHIGGMRAILSNFHPRELWIGTIPPSEALSRLLQEAKETGVTVVQHFRGDSFIFGGAIVRVLAPARDWQPAPKPRNNDSLVMHAIYGDSSVLLEGDAEKKVEREIAALHPGADLLKVAHHGGMTSSVPELLAAVGPRMAVISVGAHNIFGDPRLEVLQRLEDVGARTYRTDVNGLVTFYLDGHSATAASAALH
jgi:competence protein ComEC